MIIDLITLYNYQHMKSNNIEYSSFTNMLIHGDWEVDSRGTSTLRIMKKQFQLKDGSFYKVLLRFSYSNTYENLYSLDQPVPFVVIQSEELDSGKGFKDVKTFHGRKAKNVLGYIELGVPIELFDLISADLHKYLHYKY